MYVNDLTLIGKIVSDIYHSCVGRELFISFKLKYKNKKGESYYYDIKHFTHDQEYYKRFRKSNFVYIKGEIFLFEKEYGNGSTKFDLVVHAFTLRPLNEPGN